MPWDLRTQDGIVIRGIPDNVLQDDPSLKRRVLGLRDQIRMSDPTSGMNMGEKFNAGMGKAFSDIYSGAKQMIGLGPSAEEVRDTRQRDAPLMNTGAGMTGNISGNIAALAPLARVPGGNTVAGAGALGAVAGALQPTEGVGERITNMGVGGALGAGTQALTGPIAQKLGESAASKEAGARSAQSRNAVMDETLQRGHQAGYVVPPSAAGSDSFIARRLESVAGKSAIGQEAAVRNQGVTDRLAREAASLGPDQPISLTNLRSKRFELAWPYREIAALNPRAAADLEALQVARSESKAAWKEYNRQGTRSAFKDATEAGNRAKMLADALEGHAEQAGRPELVEALKQARKAIAQNRQVQDAFNRGTGSVDASVIGRALDNDVPLTGGLETIGRFQQAFKPYMREASGVPTPGVSKSEALASALLGTAGAATSGPTGLLAAGLPLVSGPARSMLLSRPVQDAVANPSYSVGPMTRGMASLADPETRRRAGMLARALALPSIPQAVNE